MKLTILLASLLFAATSAKGVYVEGATTDSSVVEADVAAAKLGANEAPRRGLGDVSDGGGKGSLEARCMKSCVANKATCSWYCDLMRKWG